MTNPCPPNLAQRSRILFHNSFHGFQGPKCGAGDEVFVLGFPNKRSSTNKSYFVGEYSCELTQEAVNAIKERSSSTTLVKDSWIGREYLKIHWTEYNKIETILTTMLQMGISFQTLTKVLPLIEASKFQVFNRLTLEQAVVACCREYYLSSYSSSKPEDVFYDHWNYITPEGQALCRELRQKAFMSDRSDEAENYLNWDIFKNCDMTTLLDLAPSASASSADSSAPSSEALTPSTSTPKLDESPIVPKRKIESEDEDMTCMICLDAEASTMVLPCEHTVVCKKCSLGLQKTADAHTCVRCRRWIDHVLD